MPNRFEEVDAPVDDAISVILEQRPNGQWARVFCPKTAHPGLTEDKTSGDLPPMDALSSAVKLANELKRPIVVVDPDGIWKTAWGELFRAEDDGADNP